MGLGERIIDHRADEPHSYQSVIKDKAASMINLMDIYRKEYVEENPNFTVGTVDAIDGLVERAINKIEEASMLFTKAMYKINK